MIKEKPVLAIETSGEICGAAVYFSENKYTETNLRIKNVHSEKLLGVIDNCLKSAGVELKDVSAIAVSSGPGSFTGLRIGMSTAKALAFGLELPVIAVPTFDALALQISAFLPSGQEFIVANKVNVEEIYYSRMKKSPEGVIEYVEQLQLLESGKLAEKIAESGVGELVFGNSMNGSQNAYPNAASVARWAYKFGKDLVSYDYDFLEPMYLKNFVPKKSGIA